MSGILFQPFSDYNALSEAASNALLALIKRKPDAVVCLATGATPLLTYQYFVEKVKAQQIDITQLTIVKLDEWVGLTPDDPATCEHFLQKQVLQPLGISGQQYISFAPDQADEKECKRVTDRIAERGGLDLCLLGIGKNGHLGLNEPGESLEPGCHITHLDWQTQQHAMLKQAAAPVRQGITLGLQDILAAKEVLLLISGDGKQDAFSQLCLRKVSTTHPASFLWLHPKVNCLHHAI